MDLPEGSTIVLKNLEQIKQEIVEERLVHFKGSKTEAAESLGITTVTLYKWLSNWNLTEKYRKNKQFRSLK